ncbi:hypothetical protein [Croceivirga thetidis]|uniref:Uncharacterized protein n=1 Tax=Croceivirga thetidis TaxID=2721623 RepID=A0ABX1GTH4_9FLAO|nr:hypothetical protein [Croceivirga thetidis]NKI32316.1 hypothetical protein [Croceivirga thetidis]
MKRFSPKISPKLTFVEAIKKPIPIKCAQIQEPFIVETMEGELQGKKGDWLMIGVNGEMYPCDKDIFEKTYDIQP